MRSFLPDFFAAVLILLFSLIISGPLFSDGLYQIHDDQQVARLFLFDESLKAGQFPVRWVSELGFGFGYPLFIFYPPLVYAVGELFHVAGAGFVDSIKIVFALSIFLSGAAMYLMARTLCGRLGGLVAASFYMLAPYRAVDIYVRGALSEAFSFVWLPLIILAFYKLSRKEMLSKSYVMLAVFSTALLMLTHNLVFLPFMIFLAVFLLYLLQTSVNRKTFLISSTISLTLAAGLTAFFWIPSLLEKKYTIVDQMLLTSLADYRIHFAGLNQLWNWPWGFGGSSEGLTDGISFKIGKLHIVAAVIAALLAVASLRHHRKARIEKLTLFVFGLAVLAAFLTTAYSQFIWQQLSPLAYLQFPWRFLIFTTLFTSTLAGLLIYLLRVTVIKIIFSFVLLALLIIPNLKLFQPQFYRSDYTDQKATSKELINWDVSKTSFEYSPDGVLLKKQANGVNTINLEKNHIPKEKIEVIVGSAQTSNVSSSPHRLKFNIRSLGKSTLRINTFNFPGWTVKIDGRFVDISDNNDFKLITFGVESGDHEIEVSFKNTRARTVANVISLISLTAVTVIATKKWNKM